MSTFAIVLISGLAGAFAGAAIGRYVDPQRQQNREREEALQKAQADLASFRQQMSEHFTQTTTLVKAINENCRSLQDHVVIDALKLTGLDLREPSSGVEESDYSLAKLAAGQPVEPPRDYAPKHKNAPGMLSEEYGLHDDYDDKYDNETKAARS